MLKRVIEKMFSLFLIVSQCDTINKAYTNCHLPECVHRLNSVA